MLERYLIEHCSPTLAGLKTANLIHVPVESGSALRQELCQWNRLLGAKGVTLIPLAVKNGKALVYVCRFSHLQRELEETATAAFLSGYGYAGQSAGKAVSTLRRRVCEQDGFPHEIGVFLGYPLEDVLGFINSGGKGCKCCGCWKVYCNECEARKRFEQFKKCREIYSRLWNSGRTVYQLTVAA